MKRSPSSPSSSSSSVESHLIGHQSEKPKNKRPRPKRNLNKSQINNAQSPNSGKRSSIYRGVTRHRWTGRFEAHLWDKSTWNNIQNKRGRQIYLGAYDNEESAARTYDLAALKYWGPDTALNFPIDTYIKELEEMQKLSKEEYLASLRRQSSGFSRGVSKYRGVARHHHNGRWEARIGRVLGNKYLYLGTYSTQEEAAVAYDMAAIEHRGPNAVTNFDISSYADKLKKIALPPDQPDANSFTDRTQTHDRRDQQQKQHEEKMVQSHLPNFEHPLTFDSPPAMQMMNLTNEHEHPWGICLDTAFSPITIPDIPLEQGEELPDLFDNTGFMDDIDSIFDGFSDVTDLNVSGTLNTTGSGIVADNLVGAEQKVQEGSTSISSASLSPPSSSPSTPTSSSSSTTTFNDVFNDDL